MAGGGSRRDEGSLVINNTNVFAALETLRKKKKSGKEKGPSKSKGSSAKEPVFWAPTPLTVKSWADVDDEDDDDYYATTAPPQSAWGSSQQEPAKEKHAPSEDSESEEDLDEGDDDLEEEHDHEPEPEVPAQPEQETKKPLEVSSVPKETERQLSKKERKKKELAELDSLLADFKVSQKDNSVQDLSSDVVKEGKEEHPNGDEEKKESAPVESKNAKKKKKKDKSSKEAKDTQPQDQQLSDVPTTEQVEEDAASAVDVKDRLKKMASVKKKKSSKEMDAAARAAAIEAAARSKRLAAAKKKEKNHYNQQPVR